MVVTKYKPSFRKVSSTSAVPAIVLAIRLATPTGVDLKNNNIRVCIHQKFLSRGVAILFRLVRRNLASKALSYAGRDSSGVEKNGAIFRAFQGGFFKQKFRLFF